MDEPGVHLERGRDRRAHNDALAAATGGRVGLAGVVADLDRTATLAHGLGPAVSWAFAPDREDTASKRWWPQGITSSADGGPAGVPDGRALVVTTAYSKDLGGQHHGARITVVDVSDPARLRYRHVLLVVASVDQAGQVSLSPVRAHAGGIVWRGPVVHVAATGKGLHTFRLDDIVAVGEGPDLLGPVPGGGLAAYGHRYVLPLAMTHTARTAEGTERLRYSFLSLSRDRGPDGLSAAPTEILAGEYGRGAQSMRFFRYPVDPSTGLFGCDEAGVSRPHLLHDGGVARMQGAVTVDGRTYVSTSAGLRGRGSLWAGEPGSLTRYARTLPPGPEDLCYWPGRDQLLTVTEYPGRRFVLALDRSRFD